MTSKEIERQEREKIKKQLASEREKQERNEIRVGLPHLFAFPWYVWAREFFESRNKVNLLCAANQVSKSSTQIRKCIEWATNKDLWTELWPGQTPNQFWYMYPSQKVVDAEWLTKWSQFLPKGIFKKSPVYGWKEIKEGRHVVGVQFNSGIVLFFKTYSQKTVDLQTGSVHALFADEEMPVDRYDEILFRITATRGYFHMVFTATLGQEFWRKALEPMSHENEILPHAWKKQISLYDCLKYEDGTTSPWTEEEIQTLANRCSTHEELLRRVWGKFITPHEGRKYPTFDAKRHYIKPHRIPEDWEIWSGVDLGSGGANHPAAIAFVAISPDYKQGRFIKGWRGDGIGNTTDADVMEQYRMMKYTNGYRVTREFYDQGSRDFKTLSERLHENFEAAEKHHDIGDDIVNLVFKYNIIKVFDEDIELQKFGREISGIKKSTPKGKRQDDLVDAFRYAITQIPFNLDFIKDAHKYAEISKEEKEETSSERDQKERQKRANDFRNGRSDYDEETEEEFRELNSLYECS